ncbi:hypothetical protein T439DRAFT_361179 [Meredithblackwellia eburnea MCA 4105]
MIQRESQVYHHFNDLQGRELALCYGFFAFELPSGEQVLGLVLEDLTEYATLLKEVAEKCAMYDNPYESGSDSDSDEESIETVDPSTVLRMAEFLKLYAAYRLQRKFHEREQIAILRTVTDLKDIFVLHPLNQDKPHLVFIGFGRSSSLKIYKWIKENEITESKKEGEDWTPVASWNWRQRDQAWLYHAFDGVLKFSSSSFDD